MQINEAPVIPRRPEYTHTHRLTQLNIRMVHTQSNTWLQILTQSRLKNSLEETETQPERKCEAKLGAQLVGDNFLWFTML